MAEFRYLRASEWGMTWKRPGVPEKLLDPEVFVHHTAGSRLGTDAVAAFQALNRYAQTGKNYSALDYDILVHRDVASGLITIGGGREEWRSAATLDRNEEGEAVCVMGYFHPGHALSQQPHPDEVEGVARGIVWGIQNGWIAADAKILGHRDNPAHPGDTGCPGDYLYPYMQTIRDRVAVLLAPPVVVDDFPEETEMAVKWFTLKAQPATLWVTTDGINAYRATIEQAQAHAVDFGTVPVMPAAEARRLGFHPGGLPVESVK